MKAEQFADRQRERATVERRVLEIGVEIQPAHAPGHAGEKQAFAFLDGAEIEQQCNLLGDVRQHLEADPGHRQCEQRGYAQQQPVVHDVEHREHGQEGEDRGCDLEQEADQPRRKGPRNALPFLHPAGNAFDQAHDHEHAAESRDRQQEVEATIAEELRRVGAKAT